jgi:hypothetical protein
MGRNGKPALRPGSQAFIAQKAFLKINAAFRIAIEKSQKYA